MEKEPQLDEQQLRRLARDKTVAGRKALIEMVTDLFFAHSGTLSDRERALMSDILRQLIHDVEVEVRQALAERLAHEPKSPPDLVRTLANDRIEVAHSILLHSAVLEDTELVEIIHHRTLEHQLAIAMRSDVSEDVSEALVETGSDDVISKLLENDNAAISKTTLEYLVEQSKRVDTYQNPLLRRPELGPDLARRMYWWVSAALRSHILGRFEIEESELDDALEETVSNLASGPVAEDGASGKSLALAEHIAERENVTPALLLQTLRQGEVALFEALFAKVTGVRLTLLRRLIFEPGGEGLAIACKALDFDPADFATLFILTRKARPMDRVLLRGEVTRLVAFFQSMKKRSAELVVKRWQRDHGYLHAVWQVATSEDNNVATP